VGLMGSDINKHFDEIFNVFSDKDSKFNNFRMRDGDRLYRIYYLLKTEEYDEKKTMRLVKKVLNESIVDSFLNVQGYSPEQIKSEKFITHFLFEEI
jgi:hypothetical protein